MIKIVRNIWKALISTSLAIVLMSFILAKPPVTIFLAGDSTMSDKRISAYPETGWGMPFKYFFDNTVTVVNKAQNGRSTRTFITDGLWQSISDNLHAGDYVLIQFGHNDEVPTKRSYTTEDEFKKNLIFFITQTRAKGANPVLITPVARRSFDSTGKVKDTHVRYAEIVRQTAVENNVPLIDLSKESMALLQKFGPENSKLLYNHLVPGEHPNYPQGKTDDTHFNELGARLMAELVLKDIEQNIPALAERVVIGQNAPAVNPQAK